MIVTCQFRAHAIMPSVLVELISGDRNSQGWAKPTGRANARLMATVPTTPRHARKVVGTAQGRLCPPEFPYFAGSSTET
jgi:hypothetical protein